MHPVARGGGITLSSEGVLLGVVGQMCNRSPDADQPGKPALDLTLAVEVGNPSLEGLTVHRARFLLNVGDRAVNPTATGDQTFEAVSVDLGTTTHLELRFIAAGKCSQEMHLVSDGAIEWAGRAIIIDPVRFVPVAPS